MEKIKQIMQEGVEKNIFPGAVLLIAHHEQIIFHDSFGYSALLPKKKEMSIETIFDLASLTKPMATTTAIMLLIKNNLVSLNDPLKNFFKADNLSDKKDITIFQLLNHCSGLPAWRPFYEKIRESSGLGGNIKSSVNPKTQIYEFIHRERLIYPAQSKSLYSDLGFILLGEIIEKISGQNLDLFCEEQIFEKLEMADTAYINLTKKFPEQYQGKNIAATQESSFRGNIICGEVDDDNAYIMGGVAGHAGVFSTASDSYKFMKVINECLTGMNDFLPAKLVKQMTTKKNTPESSWGLGWDTPSPDHSSAGKFFSKSSFGHLGYTGTSIWTDTEKELTVILLTNRVHPSAKNNLIKDFRPKLHDLIYQEVAV